eukprot:1193467-Prorocentrum_minimum.AAC.1
MAGLRALPLGIAQFSAAAGLPPAAVGRAVIRARGALPGLPLAAAPQAQPGGPHALRPAPVVPRVISDTCAPGTRLERG